MTTNAPPIMATHRSEHIHQQSGRSLNDSEERDDAAPGHF
jgi:hypothetical protein